MRTIAFISCCLISLLAASTAAAQNRSDEDLLTFGLQLKPIVPSEFFRAGTDVINQNDLQFTMGQRLGYSAGMLIRKNFTRRLALETGINYVVRNYRSGITDPLLDYSELVDFRVVNYEIPAQGLVYIQLGKKVFMNSSFGMALDMFPSNVSKGDIEFGTVSVRRSWLQLALTANLGWEYRTKSSGYYYLGASWHRPFTDLFVSNVTYNPDTRLETVYFGLNGTYLTLDFRYFFHEDPEKRQRRRERSGQEKGRFKDYLPF